jgi:hypothetical protein
MSSQHIVLHPGNATVPDSSMRQTGDGQTDNRSRPERRKNGTSSEGARNRITSRTHHQRGFGIGYGASDGYADDEKYADNWAKAPFRIS